MSEAFGHDNEPKTMSVTSCWSHFTHNSHGAVALGLTLASQLDSRGSSPSPSAGSFEKCQGFSVWRAHQRLPKQKAANVQPVQAIVGKPSCEKASRAATWVKSAFCRSASAGVRLPNLPRIALMLREERHAVLPLHRHLTYLQRFWAFCCLPSCVAGADGGC